MARETLWIALIEVRRRRGTDPLEGALGAFVSAVAPATGRANFLARVRRALAEQDLELREAEQVEPYADWAERGAGDASVRQAAARARRQGAVAFATFHTYPPPKPRR